MLVMKKNITWYVNGFTKSRNALYSLSCRFIFECERRKEDLLVNVVDD